MISIILPTGAVTVNRVSVELASRQNEAKDNLGGTEFIVAGVATLFVVSLTSTLFDWTLEEFHSTEHVEFPPWAAGGAQIAIRFTLTDCAKDSCVVFVAIHMPPAAAIRLGAVIAVGVPEVEL
jgi:hypothetical protein